MPESAQETHARVAAAGHLSTPDLTGWDVFPWTVRDGTLVAKELAEPIEEDPRLGEDPSECPLCDPDPATVIWRNGRWRVKQIGQSGVPVVVILEPLDHVDLVGLDEEMAAELGVWSVRLARIIEGLPHIARCHLNRWGDGAAHLHLWFFGRTAGLGSVRGTFVPEWGQILPPGPEELWREDLSAIATQLAHHDGSAQV